MSDELTVRIAEVLAAHQVLEAHGPRTWGCECETVVAEGPQHTAWGSFATHQAEQVRAVLGETTTEWVALDRWDSGVEEIAYQGHSEADAREMDANILRSRTVTPWIEVTS